jgi:hypothetical protein
LLFFLGAIFMSKKDLWVVQKLVSKSAIQGRSGQKLKVNKWKTVSEPLSCTEANNLAEKKMRRGLSCFRSLTGVIEAVPVGSITEEIEA